MENAYAAVHGGEKESLEDVMEKYKSTVYGIALTRLKNRDDADDVFQEVFLTYWRKSPRFNSEEHRKAWLINTAVNCSKKLYGKNRRFYEKAEAQESVFTFADDRDTALFDAILSLDGALREIGEEYRTVIYLHYFEDMTAKQIGKVLGLREGTVRMRLTRARQLLKEKTGGEEFD